MSLAELIVTTTFALVAAAALMTAHATIKATHARARAARREMRRTWTVTPASEVYDHTLDDPLTEYSDAAIWRELDDWGTP